MKTDTKNKILNLLSTEGPSSPNTLQKAINISPQALHRHLKTLTEKGLLRKIGSSPKIRYELSQKNNFKTDRSNWQILYKGSLENFDNSDQDFWKDKSTLQKFDEVKSLCQQYMNIKGINHRDVSRLLRTTAVLKRQ